MKNRFLTNSSHWVSQWPMLAITALCYAAFLLLTTIGASLYTPVLLVLLSLVVALHSSLQHEVLHGHPFHRQWLSDALVFPAIGLLVPYQRFRDTHLEHHTDEKLTDPYDDPESNYLDPAVWDSLHAGWKSLLRFNNTLLGRMLVGPLIGMVCFYRSDMHQMVKGDNNITRAYALHIAGVVPVLLWWVLVSDVALWVAFASAYIGLSLLRIRTFLEHRAEEQVEQRTVIIDDRGLLALLFLNNNYHAVHHQHPKMPWHLLPGYYHAHRQHFDKQNGGYFFNNYIAIFMRYFFHRKDPVAHPLWRADTKSSKHVNKS